MDRAQKARPRRGEPQDGANQGASRDERTDLNAKGRELEARGLCCAYGVWLLGLAAALSFAVAGQVHDLRAHGFGKYAELALPDALAVNLEVTALHADNAVTRPLLSLVGTTAVP